MRATVKFLVDKKRNELHENVTVTYDQALKERDTMIEQNTGETLADRYKRLSYEYEFLHFNI